MTELHQAHIGLVTEQEPFVDEYGLKSNHLGEIEMTIDKSLPILIVDDYRVMRRIMRNLLKQLNFQNIDEATDVSMALAMMKEKSYGLVIADRNMWGMTGLDLLREVRADGALKGTPFIMVFASLGAAKNAGVNNYIVKPFNAETLKAKITSVLGPF